VREADVVVLVGDGGTNHGLAADAERLVVGDGTMLAGETNERSGPDDQLEPACVVGIDGMLAGVETALADDTESPRREATADD